SDFRLRERLLEVGERLEPRLDAAPLLARRAHARLLGAEVGPRRGDPETRRPELLPPERVVDAGVEVPRRERRAGRALEARVGEVDRALHPDPPGVAAGGARGGVDRLAVGAHLLLGEVRVVGEPAVGEAAGPAQRELALAAEPDRDRALHREPVPTRPGPP